MPSYGYYAQSFSSVDSNASIFLAYGSSVQKVDPGGSAEMIAAGTGYTGEYIDGGLALNACLNSARKETLDGAWALDHAQFIMYRLAQPTLTRTNRRSAFALCRLRSLQRRSGFS